MYQVSVIIPVYKVEKYIERCAISLFEQTLQSIEYIFVDDCSPDQSINLLKNILNKYPNRIPNTKIIRHEHNRGLAAARNTGRNIAQGEYIIDCDSDDWVEPDMYEQMYQIAHKDNADIVVCDWNEVYFNRTKYIQTNPPQNNIDCVIALLSGQMHGSVVNKLIKRDLYRNHNINCTEGMNFLEDLSVTYRLFYYAHSISYINKPLYNYFKGNVTSYTTTELSEQTQKGMILLTKQIEEFFIRENCENQALKQSIAFFKLGVKSTILLGTKHSIKTNNLHIKHTLKNILSHPTLPITFKVALLLDYLHLKRCIRILTHFKSILAKRKIKRSIVKI